MSLGGEFVLKTEAMKPSLFEAIPQIKKLWNRKYLPTNPEADLQLNKALMISNKLPDESTQKPLQRTHMRGIQYIRKKGWIVKEADKNLGLVLMSRD